MKIIEVIQALEKKAPPAYQESYDNAGLLTGQSPWECTGILCTIDATEAVVMEAKSRTCNILLALHTLISGGRKTTRGTTSWKK